MITAAIGAIVAAAIGGAIKLFLALRPKTAADQKAADLVATVKGEVDGQITGENVRRLSDADLDRRLRARGPGGE